MSVVLSGRIGGARLAALLADRGTAGSAALADGLSRLVLDGRLPPGTRLPSERELAGALGVSRTLITRALDRSREQGFVASRRGAGSWLTLPGGGRPARAGWAPAADDGVIDLAHAAPAAPPELAEAVEQARPRLAEQLAGHGYLPQGLPSLRERIAERYTARGLPTTQAEIVVTGGAQHAFGLVLRALVPPGSRVLVEQPTYPNALAAIRSAGATPVPVGVEDGWDLDAIDAALRQAAPALAYLIPDFHNPTGHLLDPAGRERLAAGLARTRTTAVVDETLVELDLADAGMPPPLAAFAGRRVITVGSASKAFWGGLRLGWLRAPAELVDRLVLARTAVDLGSPVLEQLVLAELLADPEPLLRRRRAELAASRDRLVALLAEHRPQWSFRVPRGGLALWCDLGKPIANRLAVLAEQQGIVLAAGGRFAAHGGLDSRLRLPYTLPDDTLAEGVRRLARLAVSGRGTAQGDILSTPVA